MQFSIISVVLAAAAFAVAEPVPVSFGAVAQHQSQVRNVLLETRQNLPSCCSTNFVAPCDCGNCPVLQCAYTGKRNCKC
ncbi:hypothetical protein C8035_v001426 [Colletotrichum spinosum]|uniref:Uncharacterized protein n=1 Tax=Colletotrichum spinosum TaxID=1347390 RepID=A0A4R8Q3S5_9PEZI|nr:hypothetical protein C8035_v001426 [Colletotrichum spinosum]